MLLNYIKHNVTILVQNIDSIKIKINIMLQKHFGYNIIATSILDLVGT